MPGWPRELDAGVVGDQKRWALMARHSRKHCLEIIHVPVRFPINNHAAIAVFVGSGYEPSQMPGLIDGIILNALCPLNGILAARNCLLMACQVGKYMLLSLSNLQKRSSRWRKSLLGRLFQPSCSIMWLILTVRVYLNVRVNG